MKIAVCVNHVPDTTSKIKLNSENSTIDKTSLTYIINPYDEFAVEEALRIKEKIGGETVAISMGSDANKETLRKTLALGIDNAVLLKYDDYFDSYAAASELAKFIKNNNCEIVLTGRQSIDYDNALVGSLIATELGYNLITSVVSLTLDGNKVTAEREIEGGKEVVESTLPVVITAQKGLNEPRYAALKNIMAAKKKTIEEIPVSEINNLIEVVSFSLPDSKKQGRILGSDINAVGELIKVLQDEIKII